MTKFYQVDKVKLNENPERYLGEIGIGCNLLGRQQLMLWKNNINDINEFHWARMLRDGCLAP